MLKRKGNVILYLYALAHMHKTSVHRRKGKQAEIRVPPKSTYKECHLVQTFVQVNQKNERISIKGINERKKKENNNSITDQWVSR